MAIVLNVCSGNIGGHLAEYLLDLNQSITVINRDAKKAQHLADRGAKVVVGGFDDVAVLDAAFAGAKAIFWMLPPPSSPNYLAWAAAATQAAADAALRHKVDRFVYISSVGAQGDKKGAISVHFTNEQILFSALHNVTSLRPGFFMENFLRDVPTVLSQGAAYSAFAGYPTATIAARDIARRAAAYLMYEWTGQRIVGLHGPRDITAEQAWAAIGKAIGKDIKVHSVTVDESMAALKGYGVPDFLLQLLGDMYRSFANGKAFQAEPRTTDTTTPTTIVEWAEKHFKPAYLAAVAQQGK